MNLIFSLVAIYTLVFSTMVAEIIEVKNIAHVQEHIEKHVQDTDCWVVWDLDNTIMCPANDEAFGGEFWFAATVAELVKKGLQPLDAANKVLPEYFSIQHKLAMKPVEHQVVPLIDTLQKKNLVVLGLTARSGPLVERSVVQLQEINISFAKTPPQLYKDLALHTLAFNARYHEGILFCDHNTKGDVLKVFLNAVEKLPKKIIFIDDREKHVVCVERAATALGIEVVGLRYAYLDEQAKNYKLPTLTQQLETQE